jgi:hypothetical protein
LALVGFRADLVFAEAMAAAFAMSPVEGIVLFINFLPRIARTSFRTQAPLFPVMVGRSRNRAPRWFNYPRSAILLVPFGNSDGRVVSLHDGALVAIAFFLSGCLVLTTPNEIIAHTLHFASWLGIHRAYKTKKEGCSI